MDGLYPPTVPRQQTGAWRACLDTPHFSALREVEVPGFFQEGGADVLVNRITSLSVVADRGAVFQEEVLGIGIRKQEKTRYSNLIAYAYM